MLSETWINTASRAGRSEVGPRAGHARGDRTQMLVGHPLLLLRCLRGANGAP